jgi:uncharacterized protein
VPKSTIQGLVPMKIQVGGLSEGVHDYQFEVPATDLALGEHFPGNVLIAATVEKTGTQLALKARIQTSGSFECDRCLSHFETPLSSLYQMYFVAEGGDSSDLDPAEVQVIPAGASFIDLADDVRQSTLLSVPLKLLCSEECLGLCPGCGTSLNVQPCRCTDKLTDSRWEKLQQLRTNNLQDSRLNAQE